MGTYNAYPANCETFTGSPSVFNNGVATGITSGNKILLASALRPFDGDFSYVRGAEGLTTVTMDLFPRWIGGYVAVSAVTFNVQIRCRAPSTQAVFRPWIALSNNLTSAYPNNGTNLTTFLVQGTDWQYFSYTLYASPFGGRMPQLGANFLYDRDLSGALTNPYWSIGWVVDSGLVDISAVGFELAYPEHSTKTPTTDRGRAAESALSAYGKLATETARPTDSALKFVLKQATDSARGTDTPTKSIPFRNAVRISGTTPRRRPQGGTPRQS